MKIILIAVSLIFSLWSFNATASYMIIEKQDIIYKEKEDNKFKVAIKNTPGWMTLLTFTPGFQISLEKHIINMENGDIKITGLGNAVLLKSDRYLLDETETLENKKEIRNYDTFFYLTLRISAFFFILMFTLIVILKKQL